MSPDRSRPDRARPLDDVEQDRWEDIVRSLSGDGPAATRRAHPSRGDLAELLRPRNPVVEGRWSSSSS